MDKYQEFPDFPEINILNRQIIIEQIKKLGHAMLDQMHHEPERATGAAPMLDKLMEAPNQMSFEEHSDLYRIWAEERGTDW